jgi:hypothetical protein
MDEQQYFARLREQVEAMPRILFFCGRNFIRGRGWWAMSVKWRRKLDAEPGEQVYRREITIHWKWVVR